MLTKEKAQILGQLIQALDDASVQLERAKSSKNAEQFKKYKKVAEDFQKKIEEALA